MVGRVPHWKKRGTKHNATNEEDTGGSARSQTENGNAITRAGGHRGPLIILVGGHLVKGTDSHGIQSNGVCHLAQISGGNRFLLLSHKAFLGDMQLEFLRAPSQSVVQSLELGGFVSHVHVVGLLLGSKADTMALWEQDLSGSARSDTKSWGGDRRGWRSVVSMAMHRF